MNFGILLKEMNFLRFGMIVLGVLFWRKLKHYFLFLFIIRLDEIVLWIFGKFFKVNKRKWKVSQDERKFPRWFDSFFAFSWFSFPNLISLNDLLRCFLGNFFHENFGILFFSDFVPIFTKICSIFVKEIWIKNLFWKGRNFHLWRENLTQSRKSLELGIIW